MLNVWTLWASLGLSVAAILLSRFYVSRRSVLLVAIAGFLLTVLLSVGYWAADYFTGRGINEAVLYHIKVGMEGAGLGDYIWLIVASVVALAVALALAVAAWHWARRHKRSSGWPAGAAIIGLTLAAVLLHPAVHDLYRLQQHTGAVKDDVALPESYIKPALTPPDEPINVVVLYLESLERTYLNEDEFPGLTPNLSRWEEKSMHFTDVRQVVGTGWTIGGMVASQCGIPLIAPGDGNAMQAMPKFLPLAHCLSDHLSEQGYLLDFLGGADLSFAGKGKFYRTHQFTRVDGRKELIDLLDEPPTSAWGVYDDDLLSLFAQRLNERADRKLPFGLFGLTLDTHHPEGHMPPACDGVEYADGSDPMLNAVHCSDRLVGKFIKTFQQSEAAENTVLLVMSDHLAMRNTAWKRLEKQPRRDLVMLFGPELEPGAIDTPGSTLDITPTLLGAMGYDIDGWGFGRNLLGDAETLVERESDDAEAFLYRQRSALAPLWHFPSMEDGVIIKPQSSKVMIAQQAYSVPALITLDDDHAVTRFIPTRSGRDDLPAYLADLAPDDDFIWIDDCRSVAALFAPQQFKAGEEQEAEEQKATEGLCLAAGSLSQRLTPQRLEGNKLRLTQADIAQRLNDAPAAQDATQQRRQTRLKNFQRSGSWYSREITWSGWHSDAPLTLRSAAFGKGASRVRYREQGLKNADGLQRGVSLVGIAPEHRPVLLGHVDTCTAEPPETGFAEQIKAQTDAYPAFAVLVHDSAFCDDRDTLSATLKGTGLEQWQTLRMRQPYIGVISAAGEAAEITGPVGTVASMVIKP